MKFINRIRSFTRELKSYIPRHLPNLTTSWQVKDIALKQAQVASQQLQDTREGNPPDVFVVAVDLLKMIPGGPYSLLDIACGYGYYSEVIDLLVPDLINQYIGGDFNEGMLELAKKSYPNHIFQFEDIRDLSFKDRVIDIVFSSATIAHIKDYKRGLSELARVCGSWLILHRLGISWMLKSSIAIQHHYGVDVYVNHVNHDELIQELDTLGFELVAEKTLSKKSFLGQQGMSFLFKRRM